MPQYRGLLRNEHVQILRRSVTGDGMCGGYPGFAEHIGRYYCRVWFPEEEKRRENTGERRVPLWSMIGDPADILEGDLVIRSNGQHFKVTSVRKPLNGRVKHHQRHLLRQTRGAGSAN